MPKENKHPTESVSPPANSDNVAENEKYVKMLELQRLVLNKIVSPEFNQPISSSGIAEDNPDSNNP
jgi:hypothetical protein